MANHFSSLALKPHEHYEKEKDMTLKDELSRLEGDQYATGEQGRNNTRKNTEREPKRKQHLVVDVTFGRSKALWCKEYLHTNLES